MMFRKPPFSVSVNGKKYRINPDFRIFAQLEADIHRDRLCIENLLQAFYRHEIPDDLEAAVERLIWFYQCGDEHFAEPDKKASHQRGYDFEQDAEALYQSFMQDYRIDLYTCRLHWWKFCQLCAGLNDDTPFRRLVYIRTVDISKLPKEQRTAILQAREKCRLQDGAKMDTVEDYEADMVARLKKAWEE